MLRKKAREESGKETLLRQEGNGEAVHGQIRTWKANESSHANRTGHLSGSLIRFVSAEWVAVCALRRRFPALRRLFTDAIRRPGTGSPR